MNGVASPPVTFSFSQWIALFPEFSPLTETQGGAYFMRATGSIIGNSTTNPAFCDGNLPYLCYLATSHVAWLNCPKDSNGNPSATGAIASQLVGRISSAQEGSVNVQTEYESGDSRQLSAYLQQTKYGVELLAALGPYWTARSVNRLSLISNGVYPARVGFPFFRG